MDKNYILTIILIFIIGFVLGYVIHMLLTNNNIIKDVTITNPASW
jgi:cbb3-type cytochrome oxidase subunit 3